MRVKIVKLRYRLGSVTNLVGDNTDLRLMRWMIMKGEGNQTEVQI